MSIKGILVVMLAVVVSACGPPASQSPTTVTQEPTNFIASTTLPPQSTASTIQFDPTLCSDLDPSIDDRVIVAGFPFKDGAVFLWRDEQPDAIYYVAVECFSGGGEGFVGGRPGETWKGCYRVDYSNSGYAIVLVEDPDWSIDLRGGEPLLITTTDGLGAALIEGEFSTPPSVRITAGAQDCS